MRQTAIRLTDELWALLRRCSDPAETIKDALASYLLCHCEHLEAVPVDSPRRSVPVDDMVFLIAARQAHEEHRPTDAVIADALHWFLESEQVA